MATRSPIPELRDQLLQEHAAICELMTTLYRSLAERHETVGRLHHLVEELRQRVEAHFDDEEAAGLFRDLSRIAPQWAEVVHRLWDEHGEMRGRLSVLDATASLRPQTPEGWTAMEHDFREFSNQWMLHEARENELLQRVYEEDVGAQD